MQADLVDRILSGDPSAREALFRFEYRIRSEQDLRETHEELARQVLSSLSRSDQEALIRFYLEDQPPEQICREMRLTEAQFRLIKSRAKLRFWEAVKNRSSLQAAASPAEEVHGEPSAPTFTANPELPNDLTVRPTSSGARPPDAVLAHALATFGSKEKADHWLHRPNHVFQGKTPLELIESDPEQVEIELTRIDHGVYI